MEKCYLHPHKSISVLKSVKNQNGLILVVKISLAVLLLGIAVFQFRKLDGKQLTFQVEHSWALLLVFLLIPVNWGLEWAKWRQTLRVEQVRETDVNARNSFLAGIVTGMLTPNMLGNFIGRMYYYERKHRVSLILLTLLTNYAQFAASFLFGVLSLVILGKTPFDISIKSFTWLLLLAGIVVFLFFFYGEFTLKWLNRKPRIARFFEELKKFPYYRLKVMGISLLRHGVFTLQFSLMLLAFGQAFMLESVLWVWQVYFWVTLAPSLFLGKILIRESIAVGVLAAVGMQAGAVLVASLLIWVFNLLLPSMFALSVIKWKKIR